MTAPFQPCEQDWIAFLDGSLDATRRRTFELWLGQNPQAGEEMRELQSLDADLVLLPAPTTSEADLEAAHGQVMAALRASPALRRDGRPWWPSQVLTAGLRWVPVAAAALFIGILLGRGLPQAPTDQIGARLVDGQEDLLQRVDGVVEAGSQRPPRQRHLDVQDLAVDADQQVRILLRETNSYEINGQTSDRDIQNTLSYIVRNDRDPQRRQTAIQLLEKHCRGQESCQVLVYAMTQDPVASVRREAALALQDDRQNEMVRQSFIKMMVEDPAQDLRQLAHGVLSEETEQMQVQEMGR
ncbi:MAG: HEAT repeat domain-containing protein [bacterium]|jgi:hypothetical protein|nr:HEAT repeat domain-containing protein [bacterium]